MDQFVKNAEQMYQTAASTNTVENVFVAMVTIDFGLDKGLFHNPEAWILRLQELHGHLLHVEDELITGITSVYLKSIPVELLPIIRTTNKYFVTAVESKEYSEYLRKLSQIFIIELDGHTSFNEDAEDLFYYLSGDEFEDVFLSDVERFSGYFTIAAWVSAFNKETKKIDNHRIFQIGRGIAKKIDFIPNECTRTFMKVFTEQLRKIYLDHLIRH